jgi:hypothetical protein
MLERVMPIDAAMRAVVASAVAAQLAGTLLLLRALNKPDRLLLLAIPFAFHRGFFWGFVHFQLGLALALVAISLLVRSPRTRREEVGILALICAVAVTHVYGLLLFAAFAVLLRVVQGREALRGARISSALAAVATVFWFVSGRGQPGDGRWFNPPLEMRVVELPANVLGGWADASEPLLLAAFLAAFVLVSWEFVPVTPRRWRALPTAERTLWIAVVANLVLYLVVPQSTPTAKFVHFRHAVIAALLAPALACWGPLAKRASLVAGTMLAVVGVGALANSFDHLRLFDREARAFDLVVERIPERPRLATLTYDKRGRVAGVPAYLHFGAYVQARRGGVMAASFPELFWNIPVALRTDAPAPRTPRDFEWRPGLFADSELTRFVEWVIVRRPGAQILATSGQFPFELVFASPPWQVYRRYEDVGR